MDYLLIKGRPEKLELVNFHLELPQPTVPPGGGAAVGNFRLDEYVFNLMMDFTVGHRFGILTHYPKTKIIDQFTIFKNSKKAYELFKCWTDYINETETLLYARIQCREFKVFR